jgi:peptidoglycan/LPS O-acetylase OafA/YrhL
VRNKFTAVWIWLFLVPLALDFKASEDATSHLAQILLVAPSVGAGCLLLLIAPRFERRSHMRKLVTLGLLATLIGSVVTQAMQGNDFGNYLRVLLPFLLFLLGYSVACHPWSDVRLTQLEKALFWAMVISLVFSFAYGVATGGGIDKVRFHIVSVTFLALQAILLHEFVVARRHPRFALALFLATLVIELLSVTRSLLVGTALLFVLATWLSAPSLRHLLRAATRAIVIGLLVAVTVAGVAALMPSVSAHWTQRIFASKETEAGVDPTTVTRLAEIRNQYDQVTSSTVSLLTGVGYGHVYRYSPSYLADLQGQMSAKDFFAIHEWVAGHNFWVYQLFAGGLLFGIGMPLAILYALYKASLAHREWRRRMPDLLYLPVLGRAILLLAALPATSIGGNPLGPRFSGLVFGVALGLVVATYARIAQTLRVRAAPHVHHPRGAPVMTPAPLWPAGSLDGNPGVTQLPHGLRGKARS